MKLSKLIKRGLLVGLSAMLVACSSSKPEEKKEAAMEDGKEVYTIGLNFELTGDVADYGNAELNGAKLAIKLANEKAGYEMFKTAEYDNKSDQTETITIATKLAESDVVGVVGPATSGASAATYQVMNDGKKIVVSPSATQNNITHTNPNDPSSPVYEYVYRLAFEDSYQGAAMAQYAYDTLGSKKTAIFGDASNDFSKGIVESYSEQFKKLGGEIVSVDWYTKGDTDFSSILTNLKSKDIDSLYVAGYYNEGGLIVKQAREMGIDVNIISGDGFNSASLLELAGAKNLNNVYYTTGYTTVIDSEVVKEFSETYKKEYNREAGMFEALAYDSANLLIQAVQEAKSSSKELKEVVQNIKFTGVTGEFTFDENHTPVKSVIVVKLVDGVQDSAEYVTPKQ